MKNLLYLLSLTPTLANSAELPVEVIVNVDGTAFENLAVRSNGQILATTAFPGPDVYLIDPQCQFPPTRVASVPSTSGAYGIQELDEDVFYVIGGNYSIPDAQAVPDSYFLYEVDMREIRMGDDGSIIVPAQTSLAASLAQMTQPNGMTRHGDSLLIADSIQGAVYKVDVKDGGSPTLAIQDPTMEPNLNSVSFGIFGINGLRAYEQTLFYCNSGFFKMYQIPLNLDGTAAGPAQLIAEDCHCDDFAVAPWSDLYVASPESVVLDVDVRTGEQAVLAGSYGNGTSSDVPGGSSAQFARSVDGGRTDYGTLYVTVNGNGDPNAPSGKQGVRAIDLASWRNWS